MAADLDAELLVTCPWCQRQFPLMIVVRALTICPHCLHTCAMEDTAARIATTADVERLMAAELGDLRAYKAKTRKSARAQKTVH